MKYYFMGGAALLVLSACATKPEPVKEMPAPRPVTQAPAPEIIEPAPLPPVTQQLPPVVESAPTLNLPNPGSIEDFAYQSGGEPRVFFGYDQFDLSPEARDVLRRQACGQYLTEKNVQLMDVHRKRVGPVIAMGIQICFLMV